MPMSRTARSLDLEAGLVHRQSALDEILVAEVEEIEKFGVGQLALYAATLEAGRQDVPAPVDVREQEWVTDGDRNLVSQRRRTLRVAGE